MGQEASRVRGRDGVSLAYRIRGRADGPVLVLLHSLGTDGHMWDGCASALERDHRLLLPDARGHGRSDPSTVSSVDQWVGDLHEVLDAARAEDVLLVGVSMGGIQALAYAAARPERVRGVVVADSFAALPPVVAETKIRGLRDQCRDNPMHVVADTYVADTFQMPYPEGAAGVRRSIAGMDAASYVAAVEVCFSVQIRDRLADVEAPALVLWGARDTKTPRPLSGEIVDGLNRARLEVIPDAGHLSSIDNPNAFATAVLAFSAECGARPAPGRAEGGQ